MRKILLFAVFTLISASADDIFSKVNPENDTQKCNNNQTWESVIGVGPEHGGEYKKAWYYVMASKWFVVSATKAFTGKAPTSLESIKNACFRDWVDDEGFWIIKGYGDKTALYKCFKNIGIVGVVDADCEPTINSTNLKWARSLVGSSPTTIWSDKKKYDLKISCLSKSAVWSLLSIENKAVDPTVKEEVLKVIQKFGFSKDDFVEIPRNGCPTDEEIKTAMFGGNGTLS